MDLLTLAVLCGPLVDPSTTLRVIAVESAGHAYAIHDNSNGKTYEAASSRGAATVATILLQAGHRIDVGLMQINYDAWLRPTRWSIEQAVDPCTNIRLGTTILSANYAHALRRSGTTREALYRALSEYNSGSESASWNYAELVLTGRPSITVGPRGF
jgi:type IV secretion system protein VirB1